MKKIAFLFILFLPLAAGNISAQCTADAGAAMSAICQGGTSAPLGGSIAGGATSGVWDDGGAGGTFTNNGGGTPGTATYIASAASASPVTLTLTATGPCGTATASKQITVNPNPTVNAGGAITAICQGGTTVALGGTIGGGAASAIWSDGGAGGSFANNGGTTPGTTTYTASASAPSTVTLTLTTSGGSCGSVNASKSLTVTGPATANAGSAMSDICKNGTTTGLGGSVGGSAAGGVWSCAAGGTFSPDATNLNATWTPDLNYTGTATLVLTTTGGCGTDTKSKTVKVQGNLTVNAGGAVNAICQGGTSDALGGSVGGGASGIWDDGGAGGSFLTNAGNHPDQTKYIASASSASPVTLTLTATGSCGTLTDSKQIVVNQNPTVTIGSALSPLCQGETTPALGGTYGGGASSAIWSDGGASGTFTNNGGSNPAAVTYIANTAGTIVLTLTTSGGSCGITSANKSLTVNASPVANSQSKTVCADSYGSTTKAGVNLTLLESSITGGAGSRTVAWYTNAGHTTPVGTPSNVTVSDGEIFYVVVTNTVSLCTGSTTVTYTVNQKPFAAGVQIFGNVAEGSVVNASYTYVQGVCSPEVLSKTEISWYMADNGSGLNETWIATKAGIDKTYLIPSGLVGKYIKIGVKVSDGTVPLAGEMFSPWSLQVTAAVNSAPVASNVNITGTLKVASVLTGHYTYSDAEGDVEGASVYEWYTGTSTAGANPNLITGATSRFYQLTNGEFGKYIGFKVTPVAVAGTLTGVQASTINWVGQVLNPAPVATVNAITGTKNLGDAISGNYTYSDAEGDIESGSTYLWFFSTTLGGTYYAIAEETSINYIIKSGDEGHYFKFAVIPKTTTGTTTGLQYLSVPYGPANSKPSASSPGISAPDVNVGTTITGTYSYSDPDGDLQGTSLFRWFRDGTEIPGATNKTYQLTSADAGFIMSFEVTPVSATGFPNAGDPKTYSMLVPVYDPAGTKPLASGVCIDGKREEYGVLTGKYTYTYAPRQEGNTYYQWYVDTTLASGAIPGANSIHYTLQPSDMAHKIFFAVVPKSGNLTPVVGDTAKSKPLARMTMLRTNFVTTDRDTIMTAYPEGGYFWGTGVLSNKFSPRSVDYTQSPFAVTYHINDFTCSQDVVTNMWVSPVTAVFNNIKSYYCQNGNIDSIQVTHMPAGMTDFWVYYTDPGASYSVHDSTIIIDPKTMRSGYGQDVLYYEAWNRNTYQYIFIFQPLVVDAIQNETIDLPDNSVYCNNDPTIKMHTNQQGGVFTGPVTGDFFDPSKGLGKDTVKYVYTSNLGCKASASSHVWINPAPKVAFSVEDSCIKSLNSLTHFINYTKAGKIAAGDSVSKYYWAINDAGFVHTDSILMTSDTINRDGYYQYSAGGFHKIRLSAMTLNGCAATIDKTIEFATRPVADFKWRNLCMHPNDSISFYDSTLSDVPIVSRTWNFQNGDSLRTTSKFKYPQKSPGYLDIIYTANTAYAGCSDSKRLKLFLRPTIALADSDYFQTFEKGRAGWVPDETDTISRWSFGTPNRTVINKAFSGDSAWYVSSNPANGKLENTSIVSPCFDFTSVERPMIGMMLWAKFDKNRDGGILQYKVGDNKSWYDIGTLEDGINWYNSTLIQGKPGGEQMIGWTTGTSLDKEWTIAEHKLDELSGKKDVKFRLAYGSNGTSQDNEGFAFDDIRITTRTRRLLLEHFTNSSSTDASLANADVTKLSNTWPMDIINIQYHTNFPGSDPYYDLNPADASARQLFYGLSRAPYTFVDGGFDKDQHAPLFDYVLADLDTNAVNRRSLVDPLFKITIDTTFTPGVVSVKGRIKAFNNIDVSNLTLYLVVTQKKSYPPAGAKDTVYYNVFRKFLPDAGGIAVKKTWQKGDSIDITERTWTITNIPNGAKIEVIAFLQNNITKEIYQAASVIKVNVVVVGISDLISGAQGFELYPNPASSKLTIAFGEPLKADTDIKIFDYSGTLLRTFKTGSGESDYVIEDLGLKSGIYLVRISSGGFDYGFKKLIVSEK